ncbi:hypothetical protein FACS1894139_16900 [Planctomycetales bacterium]|nr:hypothetical protein FACS1894107_05730 [Planctomycetales bacterium]GHS99693.1 hypothetical protein FACS1894108_10160 [Planctomycetales bacterium]GHT07903.1 hypothetical protein FACS1894139_16900 [Planctomycetales bacterium]
MEIFEIIGFIAAIFSTISFVPQVYKTWKTKSARDVSMPMFVIYAISTLLWMTYGFGVNSRPVYIANIIVTVLATTQIILKIKYDKKTMGE